MNSQILNLLFNCSKEFSHKHLRHCGVSDTEFLICSYVYYNEGCSQEEAAQALHTDKTTVTKSLQSLEAKGFVERRQDAVDRRKKRIKVTATGAAAISGILEQHDRWISRVMSVLSDEERSMFEDCCSRLLNAAETLSEEQKKNNQGANT